MSEHQTKQAIRVANVPAADFEKQVEGPNPPTATKLAEPGRCRQLCAPGSSGFLFGWWLDPRASLSIFSIGREACCRGRMSNPETASAQIDAKIESLGDWRGTTLGQMRGLIHDADPEIIETVKWVKPTNPSGVPTWEHAGIVCTGEVYKSYVKLTFAHGAALKDPEGLFNSGLGGGTRRAIDIHTGETIDASAFKALVQEAVAFNVAKLTAKRP
jgi:hypothetical protein